MANRTYKVREVAELAGVTVRTLHHYDEIGLLRPAERSEAGYRLYRDEQLERLQQILMHRALGLPLEAIAAILDAPGFDRLGALREQRQQLRSKLREHERILRTLDRTITALESESPIEPGELFDGFDPETYEAEARERWGQADSWAEARRRTETYGEAEWATLKAEAKAIYDELAVLLASGAEASAPPTRLLVVRHREHLDRWFYPCSPEQHRALATLYESDARYAENIDRHGEGLTAFLVAAIRHA